MSFLSYPQINLVSEIEIIYKSNVPHSNRIKILSSLDSYNVLKSIYDFNKIEHKEMFYALYLNRANQVLGVLLISEGGTSATVADPKIILQGALKLNASGLIVSHNHPSGNLNPSPADEKQTKNLKCLCAILDIVLLDHQILVPEIGKYYSFADNGIL